MVTGYTVQTFGLENVLTSDLNQNLMVIITILQDRGTYIWNLFATLKTSS